MIHPLNQDTMIPQKSCNIFKVIATGFPEELEEHLKREPQSVHDLNEEGIPVLHAALQRGHETLSLVLCEILLSRGANPLLKGVRHRSVLHYAAEKGLENCVELFVKKGSLKGPKASEVLVKLVNKKDDSGYTAADCAAQNEYFGILKLLHAAGADLHCQDETGMNLLHTTIVCSSHSEKTKEIVGWLLEQGVSLSQEDEEGKVPSDFIRSGSPLKAWLEEVQRVMIEREALNEVLSTVTSSGISESAELSEQARLRL